MAACAVHLEHLRSPFSSAFVRQPLRFETANILSSIANQSGNSTARRSKKWLSFPPPRSRRRRVRERGRAPGLPSSSLLPSRRAVEEPKARVAAALARPARAVAAEVRLARAQLRLPRVRAGALPRPTERRPIRLRPCGRGRGGEVRGGRRGEGSTRGVSHGRVQNVCLAGGSEGSPRQSTISTAPP